MNPGKFKKGVTPVDLQPDDEALKKALARDSFHPVLVHGSLVTPRCTTSTGLIQVTKIYTLFHKCITTAVISNSVARKPLNDLTTEARTPQRFIYVPRQSTDN